jgi:hypothetical protein
LKPPFSFVLACSAHSLDNPSSKTNRALSRVTSIGNYLSLVERLHQVSTFATRLFSEGASHPLGRVRFKNRGFRYLVFLERRERRIARRASRAFLIACPRCSISAAKTTWPDCWLMMASPVFLDPGSILSRGSGVWISSTDLLRTMVKGVFRKTAALPCLSSRLALTELVGASGLFFVSITATVFKIFSFRNRIAPGMLASTMM